MLLSRLRFLCFVHRSPPAFLFGSSVLLWLILSLPSLNGALFYPLTVVPRSAQRRFHQMVSTCLAYQGAPARQTVGPPSQLNQPSRSTPNFNPICKFWPRAIQCLGYRRDHFYHSRHLLGRKTHNFILFQQRQGLSFFCRHLSLLRPSQIVESCYAASAGLSFNELICLASSAPPFSASQQNTHFRSWLRSRSECTGVLGLPLVAVKQARNATVPCNGFPGSSAYLRLLL